MRVEFGTRSLEFPGPQLDELRDANALLQDVDALRARMNEDGYLLLRGLHDRGTVLSARRAILEHMRDAGAIQPGTDLMDGVIRPSAQPPDMRGRRAIHQHPAVRDVFEGPRVVSFFERFFGEPVFTFEYKWLRAMGVSEFSGVHFDYVYMGRGSPRLYSCWTPFGHIPIRMGTLVLCVGSHRLDSFEKLRQTYGRLDVDRDHIRGDGWFTRDPLEITGKFGGGWRTTDFRAGDVIIFTLHTLHGSTNNTTDRYRISADTRFQPAADPIDERWTGEKPTAHDTSRDADANALTMEEAKKRWGV